jgi:urate oxidase
VRIVKLFRGDDRHDLRDLRVDVALEGDFEPAHTQGDNTGLLATDTMRNTVYALAKHHLVADIDSFALTLVEHFVETGPSVTGARVRITEYPWSRLTVDGRPDPYSFQRGQGGHRIATVTRRAGATSFEAGIDELLVLKTTGSGWEGYLKEQFTTIPETSDRIMATIVTAQWTYDAAQLDFDRLFAGVRERILAAFGDHYSPSVQFTLYRMGEAVLHAHPEVARIRFSLPNKHHLLYDLGRFGMENDNEIFHATSEPYGLIEGTVERTA